MHLGQLVSLFVRGHGQCRRFNARAHSLQLFVAARIGNRLQTVHYHHIRLLFVVPLPRLLRQVLRLEVLARGRWKERQIAMSRWQLFIA